MHLGNDTIKSFDGCHFDVPAVLGGEYYVLTTLIYRCVFTAAWGPMQNSLFLAMVATVTAAVLGTLMA